ncbi:pyridoxamine 5'-phosphate oxidase family protein [Streptomyces sp. NPDC096048]|uniref:pyridoxamine 5'-phosphate oxidase family protein n=1 Tax=Streptomyces sp. NPDC096048 TaxID=3366072 RepID=UPI00382D29FA
MNDTLTIPDSHLDLLNGKTVVLSTTNADGTVQSTAIWVHYGDDGVLRTSLATARQKYRNLTFSAQAAEDRLVVTFRPTRVRAS